MDQHYAMQHNEMISPVTRSMTPFFTARKSGSPEAHIELVFADFCNCCLALYRRLVQHYPVCTIQVDILTDSCSRCLKSCASGLGIFQPVLPHAHPSRLRCFEMRREKVRARVVLVGFRFHLCVLVNILPPFYMDVIEQKLQDSFHTVSKLEYRVSLLID